MNKFLELSQGMQASASIVSALATVTVALGAPLANQAYAAEQVPQEETATMGDEIIVTAQRRSQSLQDIPVSASVISGATLDQVNISSLENLAAQTPSVRISPAPVSDFIAIRGVGSSLNFGFEQSVGTFVDGLYRGRSRSTRAALFDIERVEVLKGPQTTFFGNNAIAGAFNITTRKPSASLEANATAFYAPNTDEYKAEAGISVPITNTLSVRAAGRLSGMNGYTYNENLGRTEPHLREQIGRISAVWTPSDNIETHARLDLGRSRNRGVLSNQILNCPPNLQDFPNGPNGVCARYLAASGGSVDDQLDRTSASNDSYFKYDYLEAQQSTTFQVDGHSLILTTGYFKHDYDLLNDVNPTPASLGGSVVGTTQTIPARFLEDFKQFSQEIRFQSDGYRKLEYMVGAYYSHGKLEIDGFQGLFFAPFGAVVAPGTFTAETPIGFYVHNEEKADTWSVFGSTTWHVTDSLRLNVGARYSIVDKHASRTAMAGQVGSIPGLDNFVPGPPAYQEVALPGLGVDAGDFITGNRSDKKFMPSVSLQYEIAPDIMAYASYAEGFKAGGFSAYISKSIFGPESVDAYEVGLRTQLFDRRLTFNLTGFWSDYSDLQETATIPFGLGSQVQVVGNIAETRAKGIEASAILRIAPGLTISGDISYLDSRYRNYVNAPCTVLQTQAGSPCTQDLSGKRRAFAPEWSGNLGINYETAITDNLEIRMNGQMFTTSSFFMQPLADPYLAQPAYTKFDARIGIGPSDRSWELAIIGKNLTDKQTGSFRQPAAAGIGSYQAVADLPRSIGFQASFKY